MNDLFVGMRRPRWPIARWIRLVKPLAALSVAVVCSPAMAQSRQSLPAPAATIYARVVGIVFDSVAMRPLDRAVVQLVRVDDPTQIRTARANDRGMFAMDSVATGVFLMGFLHDRLDTLSIESPLRRIDIEASGDIEVAMAIPSVATLITQRCGPGAPSDARTMYMGVVRSAGKVSVNTPARVRAQWSEVTMGPKGIERRLPSRFVTASETGAFAFCGIPTDVPITTRAFWGSDSSGVVELQPPRNGLLVRDLLVGSATRVMLGGASPTPTNARGDYSAPEPIRWALRGRGRLRGVVRTANGQPLAGARLVMWGSDIQATSNAQGQFNMKELPSGTYTLESRAVGFLPVRVPVDIPEGAEGVAEVAMAVSVVTVDTMRVRARANDAAVPLEEFERRRKGGFGHFLDETQVTQRQALNMADLFRSTPGMTIMPGSSAGDRVLMRGSGGSGSCVPAVFLNGLAVPTTDGILDTFVNPRDVRAVEIYSRVASVPIQFQTRNGCGSIVLWTGARRTSSPQR